MFDRGYTKYLFQSTSRTNNIISDLTIFKDVVEAGSYDFPVHFKIPNNLQSYRFDYSTFKAKHAYRLKAYFDSGSLYCSLVFQTYVQDFGTKIVMPLK